jgi:hypothetical protein
MGNTPPGAAGLPPEPPVTHEKAKSEGSVHYELNCVYHGALGDYEQKADALHAAAEHLREQHASAVESKSNTTAVQVREVTHFSVADLEGYEAKK